MYTLGVGVVVVGVVVVLEGVTELWAAFEAAMARLATRASGAAVAAAARAPRAWKAGGKLAGKRENSNEYPSKSV